MNKEVLIEIKDCLEKQLTTPITKYYGICGLIDNEVLLGWRVGNYKSWGILRKKWTKSWMHFSGNTLFPIPGVGGLDPHESYNKHMTTGSLGWNSETEYGRLRRDLMRHLINCIDKELESK